MFAPIDLDMDITNDLAIDQLIKKTEDSENCLWVRTDFNIYNQYLFTSNINDTIQICFRIYHYKTHDNHILSIYMNKESGTKIVAILQIEGYRVFELVRSIEKSKKYIYENDTMEEYI